MTLSLVKAAIKSINILSEGKLSMFKRIFKEATVFEIIFILGMLSLFIFFFVGFLIDFKGNQANVFFLRTGDYMADFYNTAKYSADRNPYFNMINNPGDRQYLPMSYIIMYVMSRLADYQNLDSFAAGLSGIGLATSSIFMFFSSAVFFLQINDMKKGSKSIKFITTILLFLSGTFFHSYERGNLIFLSVIFTTFYIVNYQSENRLIRELAYISLAFAASLKGYPALLGILLLYDKNFKDAIRLLIYGFSFSFFPFVFLTGAFSNIPQWLSNLKLNSIIYEYRFYPRFGYKLFLINFDLVIRNHLDNILSLVTIILVMFSLYFNRFQSKLWKKIGLLICIIILIPTNSGFYCGLYLFPIIILFLNENDYQVYETSYLFCFLALLNPFQIIINGINYSMIITNLSLSLLFILLFGDNAVTFIQNFTKLEDKTSK